MIEFNYNPKEKRLYANLPSTYSFDYGFHNDMAILIKKSINSCDEINVLMIYCNEKLSYKKMCLAYLLNVLRFILKHIDVKWNSNVAETVMEVVEKRDGSKFTEVDIKETIFNKNLIYYDFKGDKDVQKPVDEMAKILVEMNLTINSETVKEFLSTTIGEIFSNSMNHSDQDEIFFMYDIMREEDEFYLCVNIIDYGTTIVTNVKKYFEANKLSSIDSDKCIEWAITTGNTTRNGSGGYGLPTLISYITNTNGELYIFSEDSSLSLSRDGKTNIESINGVFYGTSITFTVKLYDTKRAIIYDKKNEQLVSISLDSI